MIMNKEQQHLLIRKGSAMARLSQIDEVMFPVESCPVFACVPTDQGERHMPASDTKAIVNMNTHKVVGVVSKGYRLVTNHQALQWAYQCCETVFPETKPNEWLVKNADSPKTGSHCFIDLVHHTALLDFCFVPASNRPDTYGPFIRLTNSYNGSRALTFHIGFFRKVCSNGLILPKAVVSFRFNHQRREIGEYLNFAVANNQVANLKKALTIYLGALQDCKVPHNELVRLFCLILLIRQPAEVKPDDPMRIEWEYVYSHITGLCRKYQNDFGNTAYAVFNAATEFASHPIQSRCVRRERHSYQRLAGTWLAQFQEECRQPGFNIPDYIEKMTRKKKSGTTEPRLFQNIDMPVLPDIL